MYFNLEDFDNEEASRTVCIISFLAIIVDLAVIIYFSL